MTGNNRYCCINRLYVLFQQKTYRNCIGNCYTVQYWRLAFIRRQPSILVPVMLYEPLLCYALWKNSLYTVHSLFRVPANIAPAFSAPSKKNCCTNRYFSIKYVYVFFRRTIAVQSPLYSNYYPAAVFSSDHFHGLL